MYSTAVQGTLGMHALRTSGPSLQSSSRQPPIPNRALCEINLATVCGLD